MILSCGIGETESAMRSIPGEGSNPGSELKGSPAPLGVTWVAIENAWNFAVFSRHATGVTLLLYGEKDFVEPIHQFCMDPLYNKTGPDLALFRSGAKLPPQPATMPTGSGDRGTRAGDIVSIPKRSWFDPFAEAVHYPPGFSRAAAKLPGANDGRPQFLGVLPRRRPAFDWGGGFPPRHTHEAIVYELHVKGFTARAEFWSHTTKARYLSRPGRENPLSQGAWHHRGRNRCRCKSSIRRKATTGDT